MANPERAYGYEDDESHPVLGFMLFVLFFVVPLIILAGNVLNLWKIDLKPACPYYDSGGELIDDC